VKDLLHTLQNNFVSSSGTYFNHVCLISHSLLILHILLKFWKPCLLSCHWEFNESAHRETYIHSIALDRALTSLWGFLIVRYIRCGIISPTIYLVLATWYDHQGHLLAKPADTTWWRNRWNAGEKHGRWILPTSTYRARRVLLHAVNLRHGTDGFTSPPKEGVLRIVSPFKSNDLERWVQWQAR
jgi:hypothetical protein